MQSGNLAISGKEDQFNEGFEVAAAAHGPVLTQRFSSCAKASGGLVGLLGIAVVAGILALSIYFAVRYLL